MNTEKFQTLLSAKRTLIMGVLNVTPDSFSDGGAFFKAELAFRRASEMIQEGADIIDIGGQSTRPPGKTYGAGAERISSDEELRRVLPVIDLFVHEFPEILISIDTVKSKVARRALDSGVTIINDISAATEDEKMFDVAREKNAPIILMHGYGPEFIKAKIEDYHYDDVVREVFEWLKQRITIAHEKGVKQILADIGFGFAKNAEDNIMLLRKQKKFTGLGVPMVIGVSRKSTIGKILGGSPPSERLYGSIAAAIYAVMNGAIIIRTHDVKETVEAMKVSDILT